MKDSSLKLTLREMHTFFMSPKTLVGLIAVSLLLGITGPFQTFEHLRIGPRIAYWTFTAVLTFTAGTFCATFASHLLMHRQVSKMLQTAAAGGASGVIVTVIVCTINYVTFGSEIFDVGGVLELAAYCFVIALAVLLLVNYYTARPEPTDAAPAKILERINVTLRAPLISLSVSDHYVEVSTIAGRELVLIRFSDAIAETGDVRGLQIHRSHWIALDQIESVSKKGGKTAVTMKSGDNFPISRTFMAQAKEHGIL